GLRLTERKPLSKRPNQGSIRMVRLPNVISQPLVPNHVNLTPAAPGPFSSLSCSSLPATAGRGLAAAAVAAAAAARLDARNRRRLTISPKHMAVLPPAS